jgi:hypothetical protein
MTAVNATSRGKVMAQAGSQKGRPVHWLAWLGFGASIAAMILAWYGGLHAEKHLANSPLRQARGSMAVPPAAAAEPGPWYERLWARGERRLFGGNVDHQLLELTQRSKIANYSLQVVAFFLPLALGVGAALTGGLAMKVIEQSGGKYAGNFQSVFSMLMGGFAAVIAGCMIFALYVWPLIPPVYTT